MMRSLSIKSFLLVLSSVLFFASYVMAQKPTSEQASQFVKTMSQEVIDVLKNNQNNFKGRQGGFKSIFNKAADVPKIAKFVAGRAWLNADEKVRSEYVEVYRDYMASLYATRITDYNNQTVKVNRVSEIAGNGYVVNTFLTSPSEPKDMSVIWQLSADDEKLLISDLRIENISMTLTQRAEFAAYMQQKNHNLSELTKMLQSRLANL